MCPLFGSSTVLLNYKDRYRQELCHHLGQEPETTTVLCALIGTATVLKARMASECHTVG